MRKTFNDEELDWVFNKKYPRYEISENGDVWDTVKKKYIKANCPFHGTPRINLKDRNGKVHCCSLAKVVLEAFRGYRGPDYRVKFVDKNRRNVRIDNLVWEPLPNIDRYEKPIWVPGHPEICLSEFYRNSYVKIRETGETYNNIWEYMQITGEKENIAKQCLRNPNATNSKGEHIYAYKYADSIIEVDMEDYYG